TIGAADDMDGSIEIASDNTVLAAIQHIPLNQGDAPSSPSVGPLGQEFVHISIPMQGRQLEGLRPDLLTALVVAHGINGHALLPTFASVSTSLPLDRSQESPNPLSQRSRCTVRINLSGIVEGFENMDVLLVGRSAV